MATYLCGGLWEAVANRSQDPGGLAEHLLSQQEEITTHWVTGVPGLCSTGDRGSGCLCTACRPIIGLDVAATLSGEPLVPKPWTQALFDWKSKLGRGVWLVGAPGFC